MYYIFNSDLCLFRSLILVLCLLGAAIQCMKITPQRASITYVNDLYITDAVLTVRRNGKRGNYIANLDITLMKTIANNVTLDVIFYEFLHNEYRRSFVEMHFKACDMILKDAYVGLIVRNAGLVNCPIAPGKLSLKNLTFDINVPSVWPFEKGKGEMTASDANGVVMIRGEIVLTFKQN